MCSADELIGVALRMLELELVTGSFGNVSCRRDDRILITPSGLDYRSMQPEDLVSLDAFGEVIEGRLMPSSEFRLHIAVYTQIPEVQAIVHTHSPCAVRCAETVSEISLLEEVSAGPPVPVSPFALAGSHELADRAAGLLVERRTKAVILQGHGVVGVGQDLEEALAVCLAVERAAARALP